jgi:hypothetical protein
LSAKAKLILFVDVSTRPYMPGKSERIENGRFRPIAVTRAIV